MKYVDSMLEVIGNTPLLKLNKIGRNVDANVFVKLELLNPSGSYKDRMALSMIEAAEKGLTWNGKKLKSGGTVCDASAGNTAPALAFICAVKGYSCKLCTYKTMLTKDSPRLKISDAYGADIYECPHPPENVLNQLSEPEQMHSYVIAGKNHMGEMEKENPEVVWVDQIYNEYNYQGQKNMGHEIIDQLDGNIDAWGCSIGSGGAFLGVALALKDKDIKPYTFGVVPYQTGVVDISAGFLERDEKGMPKITRKVCELLGLDKWLSEESIVQKMFSMGYPDEFFKVTTEEARDMANRLCKEEGIWCGMSSGANVYAALKVAEKLEANQNIVTVIVDRRDRYLAEYPNDVYVV
jgi:cysteine synthase